MVRGSLLLPPHKTTQHMSQHKRFVCPVSGEHRDLDQCSTCVECTGGTRGRCGLMTTAGRIRDSKHVAHVVERQKEAEEAFEKSKSAPSTPRDAVVISDLFNAVHAVLNTLTERERNVISLRFGISSERPLSLEAIGKRFNVSRERIRQIEVKALRKLRHPTRIRKLLEVR